VSATESEQKFEPNVSGTRIAGPSTLWQLTGSTLDATDRVGQPPQVEIREISIANAPETISVAPISVNIYRFPVARAAE